MTSDEGLVLDRLEVSAYGRTLLPATSTRIAPGTSLALYGDAGSGKSTVLATLAGRRSPEGGRVLLNQDVLAPSRVGYAEQQHDLPEGLTAAEHLMVPLLAAGRRPTTWSEVERMLLRFGLQPATHHNLLEELSGGQQQRVALARALVACPSLICVDDPVSELDAASAELVWETLTEAVRHGAVLVVATPRLDDAQRFDQVVDLRTEDQESTRSARRREPVRSDSQRRK